jgi:hypothetical protein
VASSLGLAAAAHPWLLPHINDLHRAVKKVLQFLDFFTSVLVLPAQSYWEERVSPASQFGGEHRPGTGWRAVVKPLPLHKR